MADLFGYNPKSEDLEASMLFIYTTDLYNKNRSPYQESGISLQYGIPDTVMYPKRILLIMITFAFLTWV